MYKKNISYDQKNSTHSISVNVVLAVNFSIIIVL